jgi:hypothetical protein
MFIEVDLQPYLNFMYLGFPLGSSFANHYIWFMYQRVLICVHARKKSAPQEDCVIVVSVVVIMDFNSVINCFKSK